MTYDDFFGHKKMMEYFADPSNFVAFLRLQATFYHCAAGWGRHPVGIMLEQCADNIETYLKEYEKNKQP